MYRFEVTDGSFVDCGVVEDVDGECQSLSNVERRGDDICPDRRVELALSEKTNRLWVTCTVTCRAFYLRHIGIGSEEGQTDVSWCLGDSSELLLATTTTIPSKWLLLWMNA